MIAQPANIKLTKIFYYDNENLQIPTISNEIFDNYINNNVLVKKKFFTQKWVLEVNKNEQKRSSHKWILWGIFAILLFSAAATLVYVLVEKPNSLIIFQKNLEIFEKEHTTGVPKLKASPITNKIKGFCQNCTDICLKLTETEPPKCVSALDDKDPTGCGGRCSINTEFCQVLDTKNHIFQCSNIKNLLKCSMSHFNCGNQCIKLQKRCDGIVHCSNKSDEMNCDCNLNTHFRCGNNTSCLLKEKKCDGVIDCWDKTDEVACKKGCDTGHIPCLNGDCIPKDNFCDGSYQCIDHSDEPIGC